MCDEIEEMKRRVREGYIPEVDPAVVWAEAMRVWILAGRPEGGRPEPPQKQTNRG
jgi:hypothetical protein